MGLSKLLRSAPARPTWLGCQSAWLHFRSVLTAKDLKFRFHTSALPWLPKTWCSASTLSLCLDWQRSEVPRPHFRSALTAKNVKFRFRIRSSALPLLPNMWSSAPALPLCFYWQRSEVPLSALVLPKMCSSASAFHLCLDFQRFAVSLLHFRSVLTAKDLKIGFSTNTLPSLPNMGSSASTLPFCIDCKISVVSDLPSFPKMWTYFCSALTAKVLPPQFRCRFILYIFTQFRAVLHEGLALQRDEASLSSLFASKKSKPSNSHLVKFKRFLHVSEYNLASTWKIVEQYIQWQWRSVPMVIDNNYTLSVYCCVDIIISLNGYCTCTDADDM